MYVFASELATIYPPCISLIIVCIELSILLIGMNRQRRVELALKMYDEMKARSMHPTEVTYNTLMYACARRKDYYEKGECSSTEWKLMY
jgi:pentatricopeptide repeat protein